MNETYRKQIEEAWDCRQRLAEPQYKEAVLAVVDLMDKGALRVAERGADGWHVNEWVKKAVLLYFGVCDMATCEVGPFEFHDKIPLKHGYATQGVRVVPHAIARHG